MGRVEPGRRAWLLLTALAVAGATALVAVDHEGSWYYFREAADLLLTTPASEGGGLHLYRAHPEMQFGPLVVLASAPFAALPTAIEEWTVKVAGSLAGVLSLALVLDTARHLAAAAGRRLFRGVELAVGVPFLLVWLRLAAYTTHVDDVIVLTAVPAATAAIARRRPEWAAVALFVAAAAKPWAVVFLPLLLVAGRRRGGLLLLAAAGGAALTWAPFLLGAPGTLEAIRSFGIGVTPNSGLRVLGLDATTTPGWVRPAQFLLGLAVTTAAVRRGAWPAAVAGGVAVRLLLDPATHYYYSVGFLVGGLIWELGREPGRWPWRTGVVMGVLWWAAADVNHWGLVAPLRFATLLAVIVAAVAARPATHTGSPLVPSPEAHPSPRR